MCIAYTHSDWCLVAVIIITELSDFVVIFAIVVIYKISCTAMQPYYKIADDDVASYCYKTY